MAFLPLTRVRLRITGIVCVIRPHLERSFEGPVQDALSFAVSSGTFPRSRTRLNQNLPFCLLFLFVCLPKRWATHRSTSSRLWGSDYLWTGAVLPRKWHVADGHLRSDLFPGSALWWRHLCIYLLLLQHLVENYNVYILLTHPQNEFSSGSVPLLYPGDPVHSNRCLGSNLGVSGNQF